MSETVTKRKISFEQMKGHCMEIIRQMNSDQWMPELIIGITRGGALPAVMLSQFLNVKMVGLDVSLRDSASSYGPEHNCWAAEDAQKGKRILIVDDINDTGATINWIKSDWDCPTGKIQWGENVRFAVIVDNEGSNAQITPNYYGETINKTFNDEWIVFCYENWWQ
jgi:hypoxanthine phosphoribosyltransferase